MADRASLLRVCCELRDVAFDTAFVAGEFQPQPLIAISGGDGALGRRPAFVAGIAFQLACLTCVWNANLAEMLAVQEAFIVLGPLRWCWRCGCRRAGFLRRSPLPQRVERKQERRQGNQATANNSQFDLVNRHEIQVHLSASKPNANSIDSLTARIRSCDG